jgi:hypothetical protein
MSDPFLREVGKDVVGLRSVDINISILASSTYPGKWYRV